MSENKTSQLPPQSSSEDIKVRLYDNLVTLNSLIRRFENSVHRINGTVIPETPPQIMESDKSPDTFEQSLSGEVHRLSNLNGDLETLVRGLEAFI